MTLHERALQIWQVLIAAADNRQTLTYTMVADKIGMGAGTLSQPLSAVMDYCHANGLPPLTVLVVNAETGQPGTGLTTLEELNQDRERVFNEPCYSRPPLQVQDLVPRRA